MLILGRNWLESAILKLDIPVPMRKMMPMKHFEDRIDRMTETIKQSFRESLSKEKNEEISERMVREISQQIEECLTRMAKVVEIPLIEG